MSIADFATVLERAAALGDQFALSASHYDSTGNFPFANFEILHEAGLLGLVSTREHGGLGGGLAEAQAVVAEIARGEPSTALILAMHYNHHAALRRGGWPAHLVERVSRANLEGPALLNSAQVEPRVGSPSHGTLPETIARRTSKGWRISGHKTYATGIPMLKWISVLAVTDEAPPRLASFLVPREARGVHIVETWDATGMRATCSHDLLLDDVEVPLEDIIDPQLASQGLKRDDQGMAWYFLLIGAVYHGIARAAGEWIARFASRHVPGSLGAPLSTVPRIQDGLGDIAIRLATNARLLETTDRDVDARRPIGVEPAMVRHVIVENAVAVTSTALELGGNPGLKRTNPLERHHRDALCGRAHAPQNNLVRVMAAKALLGRIAPEGPARVAEPPAQPKLTLVSTI